MRLTAEQQAERALSRHLASQHLERLRGDLEWHIERGTADVRGPGWEQTYRETYETAIAEYEEIVRQNTPGA